MVATTLLSLDCRFCDWNFENTFLSFFLRFIFVVGLDYRVRNLKYEVLLTAIVVIRSTYEYIVKKTTHSYSMLRISSSRRVSTKYFSL